MPSSALKPKRLFSKKKRYKPKRGRQSKKLSANAHVIIESENTLPVSTTFRATEASQDGYLIQSDDSYIQVFRKEAYIKNLDNQQDCSYKKEILFHAYPSKSSSNGTMDM